MFSNEKHNRMESKPNESNERTRTTESNGGIRRQDLGLQPDICTYIGDIHVSQPAVSL